MKGLCSSGTSSRQLFNEEWSLLMNESTHQALEDVSLGLPT